MPLNEFMNQLKHLGIEARSSDGLERYRQNTLNVQRQISGVVLPKTREEVRAVVLAARSHKIPLYPISGGRNWGLGSALPVQDGCVIVDLKNLNRIISYDEILGTVKIEPGVTQQQLSDFLLERGSQFMLDVTGSSKDSSIIGNSLERGISYFHQRAECIINLEIVCGTGELLQTGFLGFDNCLAESCYKFGLGPSIDGLFFQASNGVVTAATYQLMPTTDHDECFLASIADEALEPAIDLMRELKQHQFVAGIIHLADKERSQISVQPRLQSYLRMLGSQADAGQVISSHAPWEWSCLGLVGLRAGSKGKIRSEFRRKLGSKFKLSFMTGGKLKVAQSLCRVFQIKSQLAGLYILDELRNFLRGVPGDLGLESYAPSSDGVDASALGMAYVLPLAPLAGRHARTVVNLVKECSAGYTPAITLNIVSSLILEGVISLNFPKSESENAHKVVKNMTSRLVANGFYPYRVGTLQMTEFMERHPLASWIGSIKQIFDPDGIISPGRYE